VKSAKLVTAIICFALLVGSSSANVNPELIWKFSLPTYRVSYQLNHSTVSYDASQPFAALHAANGIVIASANGQGPDKGLYAFDARNGAKLWYIPEIVALSSPNVVEGVVYVDANSGVYALDAASGRQIWNYSSDGGVNSSPVVLDGVVYVGTATGHVLALNSANGEKLWDFKTAGRTFEDGDTISDGVLSSPAVVDGRVYVDSQLYYVYALNAADGSQIWNYTTGKEVYAAPLVSEDLVYVCSFDGYVYAFNTSTGETNWKFLTPPDSQGYRFLDSAPAVSNDVLYVGTESAGLIALNAKNGSELWKFDSGGQISASPLIFDDVVFFGSEDNSIYAGVRLYAIDTNVGTLLWNYTLDSSNSVSSLAMMEGVVYVGTGAGSVYALAVLPEAMSYLTSAEKIGITLAASAIILVLIGIILWKRRFHENPKANPA
jgi:outer membrane protein assembly factor BamB